MGRMTKKIMQITLYNTSTFEQTAIWVNNNSENRWMAKWALGLSMNVSESYDYNISACMCKHWILNWKKKHTHKMQRVHHESWIYYYIGSIERAGEQASERIYFKIIIIFLIYGVQWMISV